MTHQTLTTKQINMKTIWLASYWNGQYYKITGKTVRIYNDFENVKSNKFLETEMQGELEEENGEYGFTIFGDDYTGQAVLETLTQDINVIKLQLAELEEQETYFKSLEV